jgi:hypothetical protein
MTLSKKQKVIASKAGDPNKIDAPDFKVLREGKDMGGMVDKRSPFMGGGIAYAGGGKAMKRGKK